MNKKVISLIVLVAIAVGGLAFYAGSAYAQGKGKRVAGDGQMNRFQGGMSGMNRGRRQTGMNGGGFSGGKVISIDATSMTVQGRDGSSKIIFFTSATPVMKMVAGASADVTVGKEVTIVGTPNQDGSISAQSIQIRPEGMNLPEGQVPKMN